MAEYAWNRFGFGAELAVISAGHGLRATSWALGAAPEPYSARYTLGTDERWATASLEISTEGAGWSRSLRLVRQSGRDAWKVRASETGALAGPQPGAEYPETLTDAVDVDIAFSPLTNTLPIRRLNLREQQVGTEYDLTVAFVELPSLAVVASAQKYVAAGPGEIGFRSGDYRVQLAVDDDGFVVDYPGLATRSTDRPRARTPRT
ncbi:putative glycolipid-binding domain-containing protein [Cryptosporangium sp. NPDC051539]|uniref:putative glycolipid-binding domain-containing protein n=1 Tax=Cryptosporangium sp. NPDC051539 TaxID=3363962 RepID=UPI00378E4D88